MGAVYRKYIFFRNHVLRCALGIDPALFHDHYMVCKPQRHIEVVEHHNDGFAVLVNQFPGGRHNFQLVAHIQEADRFIKEVDLGCLRQCPGNQHGLLLTTGQSVKLPMGNLLQMETQQTLGNNVDILVAGFPLDVRLTPQHYRIHHRACHNAAGHLGHISNSSCQLTGRKICQVLPICCDITLLRR